METEILIALIARMIDERIVDLPSSGAGHRGARGFPGRDGRDGKDFSFTEHEGQIRAWAKEFALKFDDLSQEQIQALRGATGTQGRAGRDGKDFDFAKHEETFKQFARDSALKFSDLSEDQISALRGPRGRDGVRGFDGHSFIFEENKDAISGIIRSVLDELQPELRLRFSDLSADDIEQIRGPRGRDGRDGRDFNFDEHRVFFESLKPKFADFTDEEKETLKLHFSQLTPEEKALLKLRFEDLSEEDKIELRGPRGLRGQRGSHGRDGKDGLSIRGLPGPQGLRGISIAGRDGRDGLNGSDAPYVIDIDLEEYNEDIYFVFHYSDGNSIRTDKVALPKSVNVYQSGGGSSGGRKVDYEAIVDEANDTTTYVGYAVPGLLPSAAGWKIKRLRTSGDETLIAFADGNALFDNVWDDRASLSYTNLG